MRRSWTRYAPAAALAALAFALGFFALDTGHGWGDDFSGYIAQAMAIWDGRIAEQLQISEFIIGHTPLGYAPTAYPWGLPLLLAPIYGALGIDLFAMKLVGLAFLTLGVFAAYLFFERRLGASWAAVLTALLAVNPNLTRAANHIATDMPYILLNTLALMAIDGLLAARSPRRRWAMAGLTGLAMLAAYLMRSNGLVLVATLATMHALMLIARARSRLPLDRGAILPHALPYLIFAAGTAIVGAALPSGGATTFRYISLITLKGLVENAWYNLTVLRYFVPIPKVSAPIYLVAAAFAALGLWTGIRRHAMLAVHLAWTFALLTAFPFQQGIRYLFAVTPVFALFFALGVKELARRLADRGALLERGAKLAALCVCAALLVISAGDAIGNMRRGREAVGGAYSPAMQETYDFIRRETPEDAVIAFGKPRVLWLVTGRLAYGARTNPARLSDADYLLIADLPNLTEMTEIYDPAILREQHGVALTEVFRNAQCTLYRVEMSEAGGA